jgi:hypothetical protein
MLDAHRIASRTRSIALLVFCFHKCVLVLMSPKGRKATNMVFSKEPNPWYFLFRQKVPIVYFCLELPLAAESTNVYTELRKLVE